MRSEKYHKYRESKYQYPTRIIKAGTKGTLSIGRKEARNAVERRLGRRLHPDTVETDTRGQWVFCEPRAA